MAYKGRGGKKGVDTPIKLLLIGESGVGKSCLLLRFCDNQFTPSYITTIGIDFKVKTVNVDGKEIKLQIWDTAGQERFRNITLAYFRGAMGIILVYDICDLHSYQSVHHWMHSITENAADDVQIVLVGNKSDISDQRKVSFESGQELAQHYQIPFFEASAKTGENVEAVFNRLARDIAEKLEKKAELEAAKKQDRSGSKGSKSSKSSAGGANDGSGGDAIKLEGTDLNDDKNDSSRLRDSCACNAASLSAGMSAGAQKLQAHKPNVSLRKLSVSSLRSRSSNSNTSTSPGAHAELPDLDETDGKNGKDAKDAKDAKNATNTAEDGIDAKTEETEDEVTNGNDGTNGGSGGSGGSGAKRGWGKEAAQARFVSFQSRVKASARKQKEWIETSTHKLWEQRKGKSRFGWGAKDATDAKDQNKDGMDEMKNEEQTQGVGKAENNMENVENGENEEKNGQETQQMEQRKDNDNDNNNNSLSNREVNGLSRASSTNSNSCESSDVSQVGVYASDSKQKKKVVGNGFHVPGSPDIADDRDDDNFDFLGIKGAGITKDNNSPNSDILGMNN